MAVTVTHAKVVSIPDDPSAAVGSDEWNADHRVIIDGIPDENGNDLLNFEAGDVAADSHLIAVNSKAGTFGNISGNAAEEDHPSIVAYKSGSTDTRLKLFATGVQGKRCVLELRGQQSSDGNNSYGYLRVTSSRNHGEVTIEATGDETFHMPLCIRPFGTDSMRFRWDTTTLQDEFGAIGPLFQVIQESTTGNDAAPRFQCSSSHPIGTMTLPYNLGGILGRLNTPFLKFWEIIGEAIDVTEDAEDGRVSIRAAVAGVEDVNHLICDNNDVYGVDGVTSLGKSGAGWKSVCLKATAFESLPSGVEGMVASVTDSNTATWGATIAGGGANNVLAYFNGTNWTVMGA
jgi:hypothetical protein